MDIAKHDAQYPPIAVKMFNKSHDRFLIIDNQVYHIGASIKDQMYEIFPKDKQVDYLSILVEIVDITKY